MCSLFYCGGAESAGYKKKAVWECILHIARLRMCVEDTMKRLYLLLCLIGLWVGLNASAFPFAVLKVSELKGASESLHSKIRELSHSGIEIYHYNDQYILARLSPQQLQKPWHLIAPAQAGEQFYLLSKRQASTLEQVQALASIRQDLGNELLLCSALDITTLRSKLRGSFTALEALPLRVAELHSGLTTQALTRNEVQLLISQVSADSVNAFIQSMQDMQTRYALASNRLQVANWIKDQFLRFGISNASLQPFEWNNTTQYNVVATITGSVYPDEYIIVGGHHDSITYTTPYVLAPGADDNASGSMAAVEMARVLMDNNYQPKCSIRFVTFAAEEFGLWGSKHYAQNAFSQGQDIRLMINHDMIANNSNGNNSVLLMPYDGALEQSQHAAAITEQYTSLDVTYGYLNSSSSDSHPFWMRGYPVIYYFETDFSPHYHSDADVTANIDPIYAAEVIRASLAVTLSFANMPAAPQNLIVRDAGTGNSLHVAWDAATDPGIHHYRVCYYSEGETDELCLDVEANACTLENLQTGTTYTIALYSVDQDGAESYRVFGTGTPWISPLVPQALHDTPQINMVQLNWQPNSEMDLAGYQIYRSTNASVNGDLITPQLVSECTFTDSAVQGVIDFYYYYRILAVDSDGHQSSLSLPVKSRPVTLNNGVLIVDESLDYNGSNPFQPTDAMVDDFFSGIMENFATHTLDLATHTESLRLAELGIYSSILWHAMDVSDLTPPYFMREELARYLELGGKIFYTGYLPTMAWAMNDVYPATFAETNFLSQILGIGSADYRASARFKYAIPALEGFPALQVDSLKTSSAFAGHIFRVESIGAIASAANIYNYGSDYADGSTQGRMNGSPIAIMQQVGAGRIFSLSFPLYHMETTGARALMNHVFRYYFSESSANEDVLVPALALEVKSYPNPFQDISHFALNGLDAKSPLCVEIYNIKGQKVRSLYQAEAKSSLSWDAKDESGREVANGIYIVKVSQKGQSVSRKLLRQK